MNFFTQSGRGYMGFSGTPQTHFYIRTLHISSQCSKLAEINAPKRPRAFCARVGEFVYGSVSIVTTGYTVYTNRIYLN